MKTINNFQILESQNNFGDLHVKNIEDVGLFAISKANYVLNIV